MKSSIEFEECLKDSPKFRQYLCKEEANIDNLEQRLEKIIKMCTIAVDSGKEYVKNQSAFATSLWDLQMHFADNKNAHNALGKIIHCFQEMNKFHTILLDQASRTVLKNLTAFVKDDINQVKDHKNHFLKISESYDNALLKNAQASKNRPQEVTEAVNILSATKSCFRHTALDYVNDITMLQSKKIPTILSTLLDYYQACGTYYHQGSDLCNDFDEFFKNLSDEINAMRFDYQQLEKQIQNHHMNVNNYIDNNCTNKKSNKIEGYLFKRKSKGFKTWCRRWFYLCDNQLVYRKRNGDDTYNIMEEDLRICTVRPFNDSDRRFCFEVISPAKSHILQADSAEMLQAWIGALQKSIGAAIQHDAVSNTSSSIQRLPSSPSSHAAITHKRKIHWEQFLKIPGNSKCCDCNSSEPRWASINLGITLCIECSGVHRSLGVHYSKVRSLTLDAWEPENIKVMMELGNNIINQIYEAEYNENNLQRNDDNADNDDNHENNDVITIMDNKNDDIVDIDHLKISNNEQNLENNYEIQKATENCDINIREKWIKAKYVDKKFVCEIKNLINYHNDDSNNMLKLLDNNDDNGIKDTSSSLLITKKWTVKRFRRKIRRKNYSKNSKINNNGDDDGDGGGCDGGGGSSDTSSITKPSISLNLIRDDLITIGDNLYNKISIIDNDSILGTSDQDSTEGEDDDNVYVIEEEDYNKLNANLLLYKASGAHNLPVMCMAFALGANKLWCNEDDLNRSPLHQAVLSGSVMACEYLLLNGVPIDTTDDFGYSALHLATEKGCIAQTYLLLKHKARYDIEAKDGKKPIDIAVDQRNADIVTLLRLTRLNEEIGMNDEATGDDETYKDVMKDFSNFASNQPRLLRNRNENNHV